MEDRILTPEEQAQISLLDRQIVLTPTVKKLQQMDAEIISDLEGLRIGQTSLEEKVDSGFAKGKERMDGIEGKVDNLNDKIDLLSKDFNGGITRLSSEIFNSKLESALSKNEALARENQDLKSLVNKQDIKAWDIKKILITAVIGLAMLGIGVALNWK